VERRALGVALQLPCGGNLHHLGNAQPAGGGKHRPEQKFQQRQQPIDHGTLQEPRGRDPVRSFVMPTKPLNARA
jgi:hypothetical protein